MQEKELTKRERVIASAISLFVSSGFDKVSTAQISREAGVATGTMFHHFNSKDAIIVEAYREVKRSFIAQTKIDGKGKDCHLELKEMWRKLIGWSLEHTGEFRYMQQVSNSPYYSKEIMAEDDTWLELLNWWKQALQSGVIKDIPIGFLIKIFSSILYSTIDYLIHSDEDPERYIEHSFTMCWDMLSVHNRNMK